MDDGIEWMDVSGLVRDLIPEVDRFGLGALQSAGGVNYNKCERVGMGRSKRKVKEPLCNKRRVVPSSPRF